ncbi:MAG: NUDIX hydrolase [Gammaproteobacteria bacterium]|nr:NUDIX hydrolase [Gammaproteobacteria bacterium]
MTPYRFCPQCGGPLHAGEHGGRTRAGCIAHTCDFVHWDNPVPVVAAVVTFQDRVLLVRNVGWPENFFALVTGFLEAEESPAQAAEREVAEETGLVAEATRLLGVYPFALRNQVIIAYHVPVTGDAVRLQADEIADSRWISRERVMPWDAATGLALRDWLASIGIHRETVPAAEYRRGGYNTDDGG